MSKSCILHTYLVCGGISRKFNRLSPCCFTAGSTLEVPMTGPPGPPFYPNPNSNAIGQFQIGVSPIGTVIPFSFWVTVISQYANSPILTQLISNFDQYVDQTLNFDNFYDFIWNVASAQGFGLDIWGRIVGVQRVLQVQGSVLYFGFEESAPSGTPFGTQPFYSGGTITSNFALSDAAFRVLIYAKALANISNGSIPAINQLLLNLFPGRGNCYVTDNGGMVMTYTFLFHLSATELAILGQTGVLPKPVGVTTSIVSS
jgi:Protein of unknown function (DUF2612)